MLTNNSYKRARLQVLHAIVLAPLYLVAWVVPRDKKLWVFGNRRGFVDNSRYLFEATSQLAHIKAVWLAHTPDLAKLLQQQGFNSCYMYSLRGVWTSITASVGVVSNGMNDLNWWTMGGMRIVQLWHGIPLKKIKLDNLRHTRHRLSRLSERIVMRASFWLQHVVSKGFDLVPACSEVDCRRLATGLGVDESRLRIVGSPRNAVILGRHYDEQKRSNEQSEYGVPDGGRKILFVPTWREASIEHDWWRDFNVEEWEAALAELDATLLIKAHPFSSHDAKSDGGMRRIRWVDPLADVNVLLPGIDLVVSDYSSIVYDFSLLGRPIVFFAPDLEVYEKTVGFYEPYSNFVQGEYCRSWEAVLHTVRDLFGSESEWSRNTERVLRIRERHYHFTDGADCARIIREIERL